MSAKRTVIIIGSATAIGFLADTIQYSIASSPKGKFKYRFPKKKQLLQVFAIGVLSGIVIDFVVKRVEESMKTEREKAFDKIIDAELKKAAAGAYKGQTPIGIKYI